jgi:hypothetical protein
MTATRKDGRRMNQNEQAAQERPWPWSRLPDLPTMAPVRAPARGKCAPIGQRQIARFYRGGDGTPWLEVVSEHDRTAIVQRPARERDRERWGQEWSEFEKGEVAP